MKNLGTDSHGGTVVFEGVSNFEAIEQIALPPPPFIMLIAADARAVPLDVVGRIAARLIAAGLVVVSTWGEDCERVHDLFDEEYIGDGTTERASELVTLWHDDEPLEDAVEFFALSGASLAGKAVSLLAIAVGNEDWAATIEAVLSRVGDRR